MKNNNTEEKEAQNVDNYIITTCISLLAAFAVLINIKKPENIFVSYSIIISSFCLLLTLLESLWYKVRFPFKNSLLNKKRSNIIHNYSVKIANFTEKHFDSLVKMKLIENLPSEIKSNSNYSKIVDKLIKSDILDYSGNGKGRKVSEYLGKEGLSEFNDVIKSYTQNLSLEIKNVYHEIFNKPLNEKLSKIKFYLDLLSQHTRHYFFILGTVFFLIVIVLNIT
ncbi:unnamed protein product [marine sediment metagenome]|uniref:Uncharacterized protein n=1 Tax=marine sediment metagenome TaxID=412755 RepID=X0YZC9_9ZZZZ